MPIANPPKPTPPPILLRSRDAEDRIKVLSWNIAKRIPKRLEQISAAIDSEQPDILTLQEVPSGQAATLDRALVSLGLGHVRHSHDPSPEGTGDGAKMSHHCVIASRWPMYDKNPDEDAWRAEAPYPEALCDAVVDVSCGPLHVFTAHIPNGSTYGWDKIDTFNVLADTLMTSPDTPRILTGDFNEPKLFLSSGQILTWGGEDMLPDGGIDFTATDKEQALAQMDWRYGVLSVLAGQAHHGLRDAYRDRHGFDVLPPVTHRLLRRRTPRCFDHTFVSSHFAVIDSGYRHDWRRDGISDHSAMWTELAIGRELPPLDWWQESPSGDRD